MFNKWFLRLSLFYTSSFRHDLFLLLFLLASTVIARGISRRGGLTAVLERIVGPYTVNNSVDASTNYRKQEKADNDPQIDRHKQTALELVAVFKRSFLNTGFPLFVREPIRSREHLPAGNTTGSGESPEEAEDEPDYAAAAGKSFYYQKDKIEHVNVRLEHEAERDRSCEYANLDDATPEAPKEPGAEQDRHVHRVAISHFNTVFGCTTDDGLPVESYGVNAINIESIFWIRIAVSKYSQVDHKD